MLRGATRRRPLRPHHGLALRSGMAGEHRLGGGEHEAGGHRRAQSFRSARGAAKSRPCPRIPIRSFSRCSGVIASHAP